MDLNTLLADPEVIRLECIVSEAHSITLVVHSKQGAPHCPQCQRPSTSLHSHYHRTIADLPWHGISVKLALLTRKFRCRNDRCSRKVFCERLSNVAPPYARKTIRLSQALRVLAFALGGEAGARAAKRLGLVVSGATLLRLIRRTALAVPETPRVLGIDDWAKRKGMRYGTILVDLERHRVVDLLPERSAGCVKEWLLKHPGAEIVSRDRASAYAEAVREAAPQARQVADRFHLCKNIADTLERLLMRQYTLVRQATKAIEAKEREALAQTLDEALQLAAKADDDKKVRRPKSFRSKDSPQRARRLVLYQEMIELRAAGVSERGIARKLQLSRNTVARHLRSDGFPERKPGAGRRSRLDRFKPYLRLRWQAGVRGTTLWQEIKAQGYGGGVDAVQRYLAGMRALLPAELRERWQAHTSGRAPQQSPPAIFDKSPRQVAWLLLKKCEALTADERDMLDHLFRQSAEVTGAYALAQSFLRMVRERRAHELDDWLDRAQKSGVAEIRNFAAGLRADYRAVEGALSSEWSNGQVEGQVNRLKLLKRAMFGRAKLDLLKARMIYAG